MVGMLGMCGDNMSESPNIPNPFDMLVEQIRVVVREEIKAVNANGKSGDRLLDPEEAAKLLSVSEDWLYHQARKLPFTRKLGPRLLRFSYQGMMKWMESKKFGNIQGG
jgi:excisionase family DNA binding protein